MSFNTASLSAYIEDQDFPIVAKMQATSGLAEKANIQVGIKDSSHLQFVDTSVTFQADSCSPTYADTTAFTQRTITVGGVQLPEKLCVKDLNGFWLQTKVKQGAIGDTEMPVEIEGIWLEQKLNKVKNALAIADFQGDTGSGTNNLSYYDGLLKLVDADGTVINGNTGGVTVATGVTSANILDILDGMYSSIPEEIMDEMDLSLWIPNSWYKLYQVALKNANLFHYAVSEGEQKLYGTNVALRPTVGLSGLDRAILARDSNITIGMDGAEDADTMEVRLDPVSNKSILFNATFKRGVQYAFGSEIVEFTLEV